jgi:hypothetical protein
LHDNGNRFDYGVHGRGPRRRASRQRGVPCR